MSLIRTDRERIPYLLAVAEPDAVVDVLRALAESATVYLDGKPQIWASLAPENLLAIADEIEEQANG